MRYLIKETKARQMINLNRALVFCDRVYLRTGFFSVGTVFYLPRY